MFIRINYEDVSTKDALSFAKEMMQTQKQTLKKNMFLRRVYDNGIGLDGFISKNTKGSYDIKIWKS